MNFLKYITIANIKKYVWYIVIIIILSLITCNVYQNEKIKSLQNAKAITEQNFAASKDTVRIKTLENGQLQSEILVQVSATNKATEFSKTLQEKILNLQKSGLKPISVVEANTILSTPSTTTNNTIDSSKKSTGEYTLNFKSIKEDSTWSRKISGYSNFSLKDNIVLPGTTTIDTDIINTILTIDIHKNKDNRLEAGASSSYPYIKFTKINAGFLNVNTPVMVAKIPFFTLKDKIEIIGSLSVGCFIMYEILK